MSSGGGSTTSNTIAQPWSGQQPYLADMFQNADNTYKQFSGNPQSSVAGFTPMQQQAMQMQTDPSANGSQVANSAANFAQNLLGGQYLNANPGSGSFGLFANGQMLNNPYMQGMANAANTNIVNAYQTATAPQTTSEFEGAGRYGSGAMMNAQNMAQQGLATQLANAQNNLYGSMYQSNLGNMLAGAQGLSGNYNTAAAQQLQGLALSPGVAQQQQSEIGSLYNMGGNQQAYQQALLNAPWQQLNNYAGLVGGMQYGSNTSTTQPYFQNQAMGALGGAAAGAEIGSVVPGIGTGIGAVAGSLLGAFSDRRLKRNIKLVGKLDSGLNVYSYRYVWGGPIHIGVMADEVKKIKPHAVFNVGGFDAVDYGAL